MTPATREAGARAQRTDKLRRYRQAAAQHRAAGRIGSAEALEAQIARLETTDPELWLNFSAAQVGRYLEGVGR